MHRLKFQSTIDQTIQMCVLDTDESNYLPFYVLILIQRKLTIDYLMRFLLCRAQCWRQVLDLHKILVEKLQFLFLSSKKKNEGIEVLFSQQVRLKRCDISISYDI